MSKPFSFFSLRRSGQPPSETVMGDAVKETLPPSVGSQGTPSSFHEESAQPQVDPGVAQVMPAPLQGPLDHHSDSLFFREISQPPPSGPFPKVIPGLVSRVAVAEVATDSSMIAANRPFANAAPGSAVAAGLALAARPASNVPSLWPADGAPQPTPMPGSWSPGQVTSREIAQLRLDMRDEVEQVKNDLFGAAMGVSALKDRLDGLELQVAKLAEALSGPPGPRPEELQAWINERVELAVQAALEKALEAAHQKASSGLSSNDFFRMPGWMRPLDRLSLSEAPMILSTCPT